MLRIRENWRPDSGEQRTSVSKSLACLRIFIKWVVKTVLYNFAPKDASKEFDPGS